MEASWGSVAAGCRRRGGGVLRRPELRSEGRREVRSEVDAPGPDVDETWHHGPARAPQHRLPRYNRSRSHQFSSRSVRPFWIEIPNDPRSPQFVTPRGAPLIHRANVGRNKVGRCWPNETSSWPNQSDSWPISVHVGVTRTTSGRIPAKLGRYLVYVGRIRAEVD